MGEAFLYGNSWSESSGKIVTVHVFYRSSVNVTCTNGKKTCTGITDANYNAIFKLPKGIWTITAEKDGYTSSINVNVFEDCTVDISIFSATINVTYPAGSICTATDGVTTLTAPDTSGTWACVVPNAGTWTLKIENGAANTVTVSDGGSYTVNKWYFYKNGTQFVPFEVGMNASFESSNIKIDSATVNNTSLVTSINKISIKNCSKLVFIINATKMINNKQGARLGLSNSKTEINNDTSVAYGGTKTTGIKTITVDISSISNSYYVFALSWLIDLTVSEIYLEV